MTMHPSSMIYHVLSDEKLKELIALAAVEAKQKTEEPLTKHGAAKYLKITIRTLDQWIHDGKLPVKLIHRVKGCNNAYFFASELEGYLKKL
jgi:excisionase family DNA binding protein